VTSVKIGFLVNPVAGIGGSVGLKGSDGEAVQREAVKRGAETVSPRRAVVALLSLRDSPDLEIVTSGGEMGENELLTAGLKADIVYRSEGTTTKADTILSVEAFLKTGVDLVVFVGGDGTARDVLEVADTRTPMIGVPSGVKMHSAVFLNRPEDLGLVVSSYGKTGALKEAEVMDIDEELFRKGVVKAKLYGIAKTPDDRGHIQTGKASYDTISAEDEAREIGDYIAESMEPDTAYILGPGSTTSSIADALGIRKTLLGVDVISNGKIVISDATEKDLLSVLESHNKVAIILSPIGSQGFFLGRGNQQISGKVVRAAGPESITLVATPTKLRDTKILRVDTGDPDLDGRLRGKVKVVTGYKRRRLVEVR
jgi:predicted polyphosphate/ATP-dependent NAD kinase